ncbi:MAG: hypothetical protein Q7J55_05295 [bacterium]|nr:hypothetical protein [bacterium]
MEKEWVDHIYKYIKIDDEVSEFINSDPIQSMFFRLSRISQLGLASKIFPSATHTKLEHNLGVYYLANYLVSEGKVPSDLIKPLSFKTAAIIHGIGHFPFSFTTEIALQKASFLDEGVKSFVNEMIQPVFDRVIKGIDSKEKKIFYKKIFKERGKINHFYRFFTASLLLKKEEELRQIFKDSTGFNFDELLKYLAMPQNVGYRLLRHMDRLDYILRDMFHLGFIKIDLNLSFYFANLRVTNEKDIIFPSEWKVLNEFESYAVEKIYNDPRVKAAEAIYQKILMQAFFDSEIALANLLEWDDKDLESTIIGYQKKKKHRYRLFEQIQKIRGEIDEFLIYNFSQQTEEGTSQNLLFIEGKKKSISNFFKRDINRSIDDGIFKGSYLKSFDDISDIHVNLIGLNEEKIRRFLIEIAEYEKYFKISNKNQIAKCIWGNCFDKIDFDRYKPIIKCLKEKMEKENILSFETVLDTITDMENGHLPKGITSDEVKRMIITLFKLSKTIGGQKDIMLSMNIIDMFINKGFLQDPEDVLLKEELITSLGFQTIRDFLKFVASVCNKRVTRVPDFKGRAREYYIYLKRACEPRKRSDQIKKWAFPSTIISNQGDIDVWSLYVFRDKKPLLELVECSTTTNEVKKLDAIRKLKQKQAYLQNRFRKKIEINLFFNDQVIEED